MKPSDIEDASDSTSSSNLSVGTPPDSCNFSPTAINQQLVHRRDAVRRSSTERATSLSLSPSCLRGRDRTVRRRQNKTGSHDRNSSPDHPSGDENMAANNGTRWSTAAVNNNASGNVVGTSEPGKRELGGGVVDAPPFATPRGRPDSAPPKTYPYAYSLAPPSKKAGAGVEPKVGHDVASEPSRRCREPSLPHEAVKLETKERGGWGTARARGASNTSLKVRGAKARLSLSVGAGSPARGEGRAVFEKEASGGVDSNEEKREEVPLSEVPLSSQEFGLRRWKEYAVLRHGSNRRFSNSQHGREIIFQTAATVRAQEVECLKRDLKETEALAEELHSALRAEQAEKAKLQSRVVVLEREVEGMDSARRRWLRDDAANRGRGSNLERRLAGNTGNLRSFLFGPDAKAETAAKKSPMSAASPVAGGIKLSLARSRSPVASSRLHDTSCSTLGGAGLSPSGSGEDVEDVGGEGDVVRRVRETAELEKSELRRRHDVEMAAKKRHIEKMKLDIKKLEAEREGLRKASETQAELLSGGYAELKACLEAIKTGQQPVPEPAEPLPNSAATTTASLAEPGSPPVPAAAAVSGEGGSGKRQGGDSGGGGLFATTPPTGGSDARIETMLASEEGLNLQVRTLQRLLLEAVAAAVPTVVMPPAVTTAVDSIREGMGLPSLAWAREPNLQPRGSIPATVFATQEGRANSRSRGNEAASGRRQWAGDVGATVADGKARADSSHYRDAISRSREEQHLYRDPPLPISNVRRRPSSEKRMPEAVGFNAGVRQMGIHTGGFADGGGSFDAEAYEYRSRRAIAVAGEGVYDIESWSGSEGSGCRFPRVTPTDEDSDQQELEMAVSLGFEQLCGVIAETRETGGRSNSDNRQILPRHRQQRGERGDVPDPGEGLWGDETTGTGGGIPPPSVSYGVGATTADDALHQSDGHLASVSLSTKPRYEGGNRDSSMLRGESLHHDRYATEMTTMLSGTNNTGASRPALLGDITEDERQEGPPWRRETAAEDSTGWSIWGVPPVAGAAKQNVGAV